MVFIDSAKIERKISKKKRKLSFLPFVQKTFYVEAKLTLLHFLSEVSIIWFEDNDRGK